MVSPSAKICELWPSEPSSVHVVRAARVVLWPKGCDSSTEGGGGRLFILFYFSYLFLIESLYVMYLFRADAISKTVKYFQYGRTLSQKKLTGSAKDRQKCRSYYGSGFI